MARRNQAAPPRPDYSPARILKRQKKFIEREVTRLKKLRPDVTGQSMLNELIDIGIEHKFPSGQNGQTIPVSRQVVHA
jgi:hypothetical protein